jgi:transposase
MESTSVYWIPVFELLEARGFVVFLVNARDAKHVPGRKTDVSDAQWLQRLHSHGLLRASFRPKGEIVELRAYLRQRERLLEYAASHIQHICATRAATPLSRRSRRRSPDIIVPSTYSRSSKRSLYMMHTRTRHWPVTLESRPS